MDLDWIEDFLMLALLRNFSDAAKARHLSQPAFSRRIKNLENWMDIQLIDRRAYPVTLTPAGENFRSSAEDIIKKMYQSREECRNYKFSE